MKRVSRSAALLLALATCALAGQAASANPQAPLDLQGYNAELSRWSASAARLRAHPQEAATLREQLPDHWTVAVEGEQFLVSTKWLGRKLDHVAANPQSATEASREISNRLRSMLQDSQALGAITEPHSGRARARLNDILKRREFRSVRAPTEVETFWERIVDRLWQFIRRLFSRVGTHPAVTSVFLWGVVIVLGLIFVGWLIYALRELSLADVPFRRRREPAEPAGQPGTWREWAPQAGAAAARGDYREAIRIIYGAAVRRLGEAGVWQVDPARTHREYVRLLPAGSAERPRLVTITTCFERVWYGHAPASSADYEMVRAELEALG